jgi:hypothetical protein
MLIEPCTKGEFGLNVYGLERSSGSEDLEC